MLSVEYNDKKLMALRGPWTICYVSKCPMNVNGILLKLHLSVTRLQTYFNFFPSRKKCFYITLAHFLFLKKKYEQIQIKKNNNNVMVIVMN